MKYYLYKSELLYQTDRAIVLFWGLCQVLGTAVNL